MLILEDEEYVACWVDEGEEFCVSKSCDDGVSSSLGVEIECDGGPVRGSVCGEVNGGGEVEVLEDKVLAYEGGVVIDQ